MVNDALGYNTDNIRNLASDLDAQLRSFEEKIDGMFNVIDVTLNSKDYWQGQAYDQFKTYCDSYKKDEIDPLMSEIKDWINSFNAAADSADETTKRNVGLFS